MEKWKKADCAVHCDNCGYDMTGPVNLASAAAWTFGAISRLVKCPQCGYRGHWDTREIRPVPHPTPKADTAPQA